MVDILLFRTLRMFILESETKTELTQLNEEFWNYLRKFEITIIEDTWIKSDSFHFWSRRNLSREKEGNDFEPNVELLDLISVCIRLLTKMCSSQRRFYYYKMIKTFFVFHLFLVTAFSQQQQQYSSYTKVSKSVSTIK